MSDSSFPKRGEDDFLTREEISFIQRLLGRPEAIPQAFWSMAIQKLALDGLPIPASQIQGGGVVPVQTTSTIVGQETTASTSYTDLATPGPTLTNLSDGTYLTFHTALTLNSTADYTAMGLSINGAAPETQTVLWGTGTAISPTSTKVSVLQLRNNNNNTITAKYLVLSGTGTWDYRNLIALKIGN